MKFVYIEHNTKTGHMRALSSLCAAYMAYRNRAGERAVLSSVFGAKLRTGGYGLPGVKAHSGHTYTKIAVGI